MIEIKEILRLRKAGQGYRTIADRTGVDRKAVRRYVEAAGERLHSDDDAISDVLVAVVVEAVRPGGSHEVSPARVKCRAHASLIKGWIEDGCKAPKLGRLMLRHTGCEVRPVQDTVRVVEGRPGVLEIDFLVLGTVEFGERRVALNGLLCTAAYSRQQYVGCACPRREWT